jgi:restriction endonuclease S subunit
MDTKEILGRIFKDPTTKYELTEFENQGKPIHDILSIYPKTATTGRETGKTKYYVKSFIPFSTGNDEVQVYVEEGKSGPEEIVRQLWVYKLIHQYGYKVDEIDLEKSVQFGTEVGTNAADIIVYSDSSKLTLKIIIECKKPKRKDGIEQLRRNARTRVSTGDVLISIKGTLGEVGLAEASLLPANMNRDVAIIKLFSNSPSGEYTTVFLRSKFGEYQLAREGSGGVQQMITLERLRKVRIPIIGKESKNEVSKLYQAGLKKRQEAKNFYTQAQFLLDSELGRDKINFERPVSFTASLSKAISDGRFDADYFQPQFLEIQKIIRQYPNGFDFLINCATPLRPNIDPRNTPFQIYNYIELSNINASLGMVDGFETKLGQCLPSRARRQVQCGDVIASSVVGSIDKAAIIDNDKTGFISSTGFFHLRPKTISSEYLLILVRSQCVRMQFQQHSTGGILSAVPDNRLKHVLVPKLPEGLQSEITQLIQQSHTAKNESHKLLQQAKFRVEQLIEAAVQG